MALGNSIDASSEPMTETELQEWFSVRREPWHSELDGMWPDIVGVMTIVSSRIPSDNDSDQYATTRLLRAYLVSVASELPQDTLIGGEQLLHLRLKEIAWLRNYGKRRDDSSGRVALTILGLIEHPPPKKSLPDLDPQSLPQKQQ